MICKQTQNDTGGRNMITVELWSTCNHSEATRLNNINLGNKRTCNHPMKLK